jgi:hypothetical protein
MVSQSFSEVYGSEGSLSNFLLGFEKFMKIALVDPFLELDGPQLHNGSVTGGKGEHFLAALSLELDSNGSAQLFLHLHEGSGTGEGW